MNEIDIEAWVEAAPHGQSGFREVVHIVLDSIGRSQNLQAKMVMKGGLLLAIRYESTRFTRDLDFSTSERYSAEGAEALLEELENGLVAAEDRLPARHVEGMRRPPWADPPPLRASRAPVRSA